MPNLTHAQLLAFNQNGYLVIKDFCSDFELKQLSAAIDPYEAGCHFVNNKRPWWRLQEDEEDLTYLTHSEKVVKSIARLMDGKSPVCHIHTKTIAKKTATGGAYNWHQDYAYWYANKLLFANQVTSFMVAISHMNTSSGCSQVIKGSHKLGRLDHGFGNAGMPPGADEHMVQHALESMELVNMELDPGDALFFHSNLLHRGQPNISGKTSFSIVSTYASQQNLSTNDTYAAWHLPIEVISGEAIRERQVRYLAESEPGEKQGNAFIKELAAIQLLHAS